MSKVVARSVRNSEFQNLKDGDLCVLFFRESCPYCRDFKPTWNRVAKELKQRWNRASIVYDGPDAGEGSPVMRGIVEAPQVVKLDVTKFPAVKNTIRFPTVPCVALYKKGARVLFYTGADRSLPTVLSVIEDYYRHNKKPPVGQYKVGDANGNYPNDDPDGPSHKGANRTDNRMPLGDRRPLDDRRRPVLEQRPRDTLPQKRTRVDEPDQAKRHKESVRRSQLRVRLPRALKDDVPSRDESTLDVLSTRDVLLSRDASRPPLRDARRLPSVRKIEANDLPDDVTARFLALLLKRRGEL